MRCFWLVLTDRKLADRISELLKTPAEPAEPPLPVGAIQLLSLFQREGRFIDFLNEDIDSYGDAQVGAAVRDIHRGCRKVLVEHVELMPIIKQEEESRVEVPAGFDPAVIRLTGNVHGEPPFHGTLKHHGWIVQKIQLPEALGGTQRVVATADVEV
jgi:hypothetical protein